MSDCGAGRESCCISLEVTGGTFYRSYGPNPNGGTSSDADPATVSGFRLDKYDVTVGRFRRFVAAWAAGWRPLPGSGKHAHLNGAQGLIDISGAADAGATYETGWLAADNGNVAATDASLICQVAEFASWTPSVGMRENRPINCVNWFEAQAFCIWDGGFLPSEAEYEYAAAGGSQQRVYPWGSTESGGAIQYAICGDDQGNCYYPSGTLERCSGMSIAPVGTATSGAGRFGQLDLSGNMWQWVADWFFHYTECTDCAALTAPPPDFRLTAVSSRGLRGGSFSSSTPVLRAPARVAWSDPGDRSLNEGFRCARIP
jgi:sulfatase modifying factor 1